MDATLKSRWVAALRSGDYEQGRSALRTADGKFCCLGVLANVVDPSGWEPALDTPEFFRYRSSPDEPSLLGTLTPRFCRRVGLKSQSRYVVMSNNGDTFDEIADAIEACE